MGFRGIERVKGGHHTTVITWVKHLGQQLPDAPQAEQIPEVGELDELETLFYSRWRPNCQQNRHDSGCSSSVSPWEKEKTLVCVTTWQDYIAKPCVTRSQ
jgi:hypothetical protein